MAEAWERRWKATRPLALAAGRLLFRFRVEGPAPAAEGPLVLASNHRSHVDPPFVGLAAKRPVRFMAAADLQGLNRGLDFALGYFGTIPLPRTGVSLAAMKEALAHLDEGGAVGVFPEGRRTARWGETEPKEGAAWLALRAGVPLIPVAVLGTNRVMALESRMPTPALVTVRFGRPLPPVGTRAELTERWKASVGAMLRDR